MFIFPLCCSSPCVTWLEAGTGFELASPTEKIEVMSPLNGRLLGRNKARYVDSPLGGPSLFIDGEEVLVNSIGARTSLLVTEGLADAWFAWWCISGPTPEVSIVDWFVVANSELIGVEPQSSWSLLLVLEVCWF